MFLSVYSIKACIIGKINLSYISKTLRIIKNLRLLRIQISIRKLTARWSRGMIPASGARGPGFKSWTSPDEESLEVADYPSLFF